jgi:NAD(P)-dependent dehydrogenase (short-subunit alcohol dehydrogenase family)
MLDRGQGKIISISSGSGLRGSARNAHYSASKAGVIAFTQALANEVREHGLQVNVICPGPIITEMLDSRPDTSPVDESNFLETEDVAGAALFLASDYSGRMNAQIISVRNSNRW